MNYKKIENAEVIRRFSKKFDKDFYLMKFQKTTTSIDGEGELYLLLKVVGTIHVDEKLAMTMEVQSSEQTARDE